MDEQPHLTDRWGSWSAGAGVGLICAVISVFVTHYAHVLTGEPLDFIGYALAAGISLTLGPVITATMWTLIRRAVRAERAMGKLARTDPLTGLLNRRAFFAIGAQAWTQDGAIAVLLLDVDHFKRVNDTYGHAQGDVVLARVGALLAQHVPKAAAVARVGGEEFAILLPDCNADQAHQTAESLRLAIAQEHFGEERKQLRITLSVGVASTTIAEIHDLSALLNRADRALYGAKGTGRDRVVAYRTRPPTPAPPRARFRRERTPVPG